MAKPIDLNCDMGEFEQLVEADLDLAIMPLISRCNIAVGGHAGNEDTIKYCFNQAAEHDLAIGLHPSYVDRQHFGRTIPDQPWSQTADSLRQQIDLGLAIGDQLGINISHVKFHGALYNQIEAEEELARQASVLLAEYPHLAVLGMANGNLQNHCARRNLAFIREAFIDRRYQNAQQLQPRSEAGSVYESPEQIIRQALAIASEKPITTSSNELIHVAADSLCIHSDTPGAVEMIRALHERFTAEDIEVI